MNSTNSTIAETLASNKNRYISGIVISSVFLIIYFTYLIGCFIYHAVKKFKLSSNNKKGNTTIEKSQVGDSNTSFFDEASDTKKTAPKTLKGKITEWIKERDYDIEKISFVFYLVLFEIFAVSMFWIFFEFPTNASNSQIGDYKNLIDVALMTLLGLGLSMSCIKNAQFHTIGMTILLAALSFQFSIIAQGFWSKIYEYAILKDAKLDNTFNTVIFLDMKWLVHGFYGAFTVLISTSVVVGKTSPVQLVLMAFSEIFIYSVNYFCIILVLGAIDYGGSMFIHLFGACYGLTASWSLYKPSVFQSQTFVDHHSKSSDVIAIIGTVLLWVLMPSFNSALISNSQYQYRAQMTTFIAMASSCVIHFVVMRLIRGKFCMRDLQRGAIVGGISMASVQSIIVSPGGSLTIGLVAGGLAGLSLCAIQPLIKHLRVYDTCNVFSTHLLIGLYGGLVSIIASGNAIDNASRVKIYGDDTKTLFGAKYTNLWGFQICALCITVVTSTAGGFLHGFVYNKWLFVLSPEKTFEDSAYWILPKEPVKKEQKVNSSGDQELMVQCTVCSTIEERLKYSHQELKRLITEKSTELEKKNISDLSLAKDQNEKQVNELKEKVNNLENQLQNLMNSLNNSQLELAKKEEEERKRRELEEKMQREQLERKRQEEEARRKKEEEDRIRREEEERKRKEKLDEDERKRKAQLEEDERKRKEKLEDDERKRKAQQEEEDRLRKAQQEEDERKRKAQLEEDERKRKEKLEDDERKRKAQQEEEDRLRKLQLEEDERKRKAQLEEDEKNRLKEEEERKRLELSQMSKVMQDLLSKSTATEDESGTRYQSFEGINVDYNVLSVFDMLRGEELLGFDDSMDNMDSIEEEEEDETHLSEYEKLHKHDQKKSSFIVLHYKDGKLNNKMLFYKKGLRFKDFMPELTADSMFHIIFRVRCKESGGITLYKYLVATYAGENVKAMHKGILTGNANVLGKFLGVISYQVIEKDNIKEEIIEKMKSSATGNVQKMTFFVQ